MAAERGERGRTVDRLVADLAPVRPRRASHDALLLGMVMLAEFAAIAALMPMRADIDLAMLGPMFWWKLVGAAGIAVSAAAALLALVSPAARARAGRGWIWLSAGGAALAGLALWMGGAMPVDMDVVADWREGLMCVGMVELYAVPVWLTAVLIARRGAPARPRAAAAAVGLCGAAWGGAAFALWCPIDDPLYIVVWYGLALLIGAGVGFAVLTRWLRW